MIKSTLRVMAIIGTRPEAVKMAPLVLVLRATPGLHVTLCHTGQHRDLMAPILNWFGVKSDVNLSVTGAGGLSGLASQCMAALDPALAEHKPDCVVVHGDTTSAHIAALTAYYRSIPVVHVEAGLRTGDMGSPWPEEHNRRAISLLASLHLAPTSKSAENLVREGVAPETVHVTGNTVVDALNWTMGRMGSLAGEFEKRLVPETGKEVVLVTAHRRENHGKPIEAICRAVRRLAKASPDILFVLPVHPNPQAKVPIEKHLSSMANVRLVQPLSYPEMVWMMQRSKLILTDSGGVQEEAPSLGRPMLILRDKTERMEIVDAGGAIVVGSDEERIVKTAQGLLTDAGRLSAMSAIPSPFGDGKASERIARLIADRAWVRQVSLKTSA